MKKLILPAAVSVCFAVSCSKTDVVSDSFPGTKGVTVAFSVDGDASTRSQMLPDGLSSEWEDGDRLSVWALNSAGVYELEACPFRVYGTSGGNAIFTATLAEAMPAGRYTYFACSPEPQSVSGTAVTFGIPSVQDGRVSGGADILVAEPLLANALVPVENLSDYTRLGLRMDHLLHHFRFFLSEQDNPFPDERINRMVLEFSEGATGKITTDITDPLASPAFTPESSTITLNLAEELQPSSDQTFAYACASLRPGAFSSDATMVIKSYTASKYGISDPISLAGRNFESGHSTPVRITASTVADLGIVRFTVPFNNIGEDADSVTLTAPSGCTWGNGSNTYTYNPGRKFTAGESFEIVFTEIEDYRALSGQTVSVTFDTEHVTYTKNVVMPLMTSGSLAEISVGLPYLLEEDFSTVESFSSNDEYATLVTGDQKAVSFLDGWTGARVGASAGLCVRIACRRETSSDYDARLDSAPIIALKKSADLELSFDYGANNQYYNLLGDGNVGQTVNIGYVTSDTAYSSGSTTGTYSSDFYIKEYTGSYESTPNSATYVLPSVPEGLVRISWRSVIEHKAGASNTTCWLYIDNVKVRIKSN
ncbi:MAG: hypothetical protein ACI39U_00365 [Candidatus Cryptobacteroides sp.]